MTCLTFQRSMSSRPPSDDLGLRARARSRQINSCKKTFKLPTLWARCGGVELLCWRDLFLAIRQLEQVFVENGFLHIHEGFDLRKNPFKPWTFRTQDALLFTFSAFIFGDSIIRELKSPRKPVSRRKIFAINIAFVAFTLSMRHPTRTHVEVETIDVKMSSAVSNVKVNYWIMICSWGDDGAWRKSWCRSLKGVENELQLGVKGDLSKGSRRQLTRIFFIGLIRNFINFLNSLTICLQASF